MLQTVHNSVMQIGISLPHFRSLASPEAIRRIAEFAETIGLDSVWVTDHILLTDDYSQTIGDH